MKRALDVVVSSAGLLVLSPIMVPIAIWVRLDSRGPSLFVQRRLGHDQTPFSILKFRTMVDRDAESIDQISEHVVQERLDQRITRAGRFLRSTSLDELPQLINVLKGEMSLVGPRPILPDQLAAIPPDYMSRFRVRPGVTGLAQVRGRRGLGWMEQLAADVEYAAERSFSGDIAIILRTFGTVMKREGIYADESKNWRAYLPENGNLSLE